MMALRRHMAVLAIEEALQLLDDCSDSMVDEVYHVAIGKIQMANALGFITNIEWEAFKNTLHEKRVQRRR